MDGENVFSSSILALYFFGGASTQQQFEIYKAFSVLFLQILQREQCSSQRTDNLRLLADIKFCTKLFFQRADNTGIFGNTSGHHADPFDADPFQQGNGFAGDGIVDTVGDICFFLVLCNQGDDLRFRKDGAHTGNFDIFFPVFGYRSKFCGGDFQCARHHFQKAPGTGGTFIIHDKIGHIPIFIQADGFGVLSTDIQNRAYIRVQIMCALAMTADLGHIAVGK